LAESAFFSVKKNVCSVNGAFLKNEHTLGEFGAQARGLRKSRKAKENTGYFSKRTWLQWGTPCLPLGQLRW
jgi:hypothetical protein